MKFSLHTQGVLFFVFLTLTACGGQMQPRVTGGEIADLRTFPQDLRVYAALAGPDTVLLTPQQQQAHWQRYRQLYFAPWTKAQKPTGADAVFAPLRHGYAENLLPHSEADIQALLRNSYRESYPNRLEDQRHGIVLRPTALRAAPTDRPRFNNPNTAGQGFPFDMWQYASLPAGMPVAMTHDSRDGSWIFVENALASGWISADDAAGINADSREQIMRQPLLAVLAENVVLTDEVRGGRLVNISLGTLLPLAEKGEERHVVLFPQRNASGQAVLVRAVAQSGTLALAPVPLTPSALASVGNELMGQPYGWGSLYRNRDCSAMLRDVFTPFGLWLPRNSAAQAKAWHYVDIEGQGAENKEAAVRQRAMPFATLLSYPGHISLYVGQYQGRAVMFHNMWGVRTERNGVEGRYIVGKAAVTSLQPGVELPDAQDKNSLIARMRGMSILDNSAPE